MNKVLIVVDMLDGFLRPGRALYCGRQSEDIIPFVRAKVEEYGKSGELVIFVADNHDPEDLEFQRFPKHCVAGTPESEVISELKGLAKNSIYLPKKRYSAFHGTDLEKRLKKLKPDLVEVVGVCTNICVLYTVEELRNRDIPTRVYRAGVASFDNEAHEWALKQMQSVLGAEII
jgi:nicotinamidase/pyrazinamidase